jgi:hypothetical protein
MTDTGTLSAMLLQRPRARRINQQRIRQMRERNCSAHHALTTPLPFLCHQTRPPPCRRHRPSQPRMALSLAQFHTTHGY